MSINWKFLRLMLSGTTLIAMPAFAQSAVNSPTDTASDQGAAPAATPSPDEIVVTAQKRSERLQDVPITITTVSATKLDTAGIQSISALPQVVPAFRFDNLGSWPQLSIRGVGTAVSGPSFGSGTGIYVDGFLVPTQPGNDFDFLNVSSIQVLKGPQGTLFGRNTPAGALLVTTSDPSTTPGAQGRLSYGRFNDLDAQVYGTAGLNSRIAVDLGARYRRGDGFVRNIVPNTSDTGRYENLSLRAGLKVDLDDSGGNFILVRYTHRDIDDPTTYLWNARDGVTLGAFIPGNPVAAGSRDISQTEPIYFKSNADAVTGKARFDLGFASLTSYTMYSSQKSSQALEFDGTPAPLVGSRFHQYDRTFTQEFNLNSEGSGPLTWVLGAYYLKEKAGYPNLDSAAFGSPFATIWSVRQDITSYALFGDATYKIGDHLFLTGGVRYSHEHSDAAYQLVVPDAASGQGVGTYPASKNWQSLTPRAVVRYEFNPSSSVYASYSRGYKAGFFNVTGLSQTAVEPEKLTSFELGYKYSAGSTRASISAFRYSYKDLQVGTYTGTVSLVSNAANSTIYGGEIEASTEVVDGLRLSIGAAYTHARYDSFTDAPRFDQILDPANPAFGTIATSVTDASGNELIRAPEFSGNAAADYVTSLGSGKLAFNANYAYSSKFFFDAANQFPQRAFGLLNLNVTWTDPSDHWSFSVFGRNVTNRKYANQIFSNPLAIVQTWGAPVTYGATVSFKY